MKPNLTYLYLLSPLHTGGTAQEGNLVGIARETHSDLPYLPSSTLRGRFRASTSQEQGQQNQLWGNTIEDVQQGRSNNLTQGALWIGDAAILWFPIPSLSHGVVWVTSPFLLRRWLRLRQPDSTQQPLAIPQIGSFSGKASDNDRTRLYLKDVIFQPNDLTTWQTWPSYIPSGAVEVNTITQALVLSDAHCHTLIQMSLWRQVRVNLGDGKTVDETNGGFRYEEAIPPETLMYFPWDTTTSANGTSTQARDEFQQILNQQNAWQFGGQESLGRGFTEIWTAMQNTSELTQNATSNQEEN